MSSFCASEKMEAFIFSIWLPNHNLDIVHFVVGKWECTPRANMRIYIFSDTALQSCATFYFKFQYNTIPEGYRIEKI